MSLESDEIQLTPNSQLFLFNSLVASLIVIHFLLQMYSKMLGSISHERDHIMIPGSGVNHIEVSITFQASTAVILHQFQMWQVITFNLSLFRCLHISW
jgi:hypothetical protein